MAKLSNILTKYSGAEIEETNLEAGKVFYYTMPTGDGTYFCQGTFWRAPCAGTAEIEVWGASGSGGMMCCCGIGLPGNPGAYAKRTVRVDSSTWIHSPDDHLGIACGNASALCFRGCSSAARIFVCSPNGTLTGPTGSNTCFCMCVQGGMGGMHLCMENCSPLTRYASCNYCTTQVGSTGCGIVCNYGGTFNFLPNAFGGDVNCQGEFSCLFVGNCNKCCTNCFTAYVKTAPGVWGSEPQTIIHQYSCTNWEQMRNNGFHHYISSINGMARSPTHGSPNYTCYDSNQYCGCYEYQGCGVYVTHGIPGYGGNTCSGVRDMGTRGGSGALKIKFIAD